MSTLIWISIFIATFFFMELIAWVIHKYVMHGCLWVLHKDHHKKDHHSWWERNDAFFLFFATISFSCFKLYDPVTFWMGESIGFGILAYGIAYFLVHDIFIHQRFKLFRNANHWYAKGLRRAHKIHHKNIGKSEGECYGMLFVPFKYFKK